MRRITITLAVATIAGSCQPVSQTVTPAGQEAEAPRTSTDGLETIAGVYTLTTPDANERVEAAIDEAVSDMNFIIRGIARGRLRDTNRVAQQLTITVDGNDVGLQLDQRPFVMAPANGPPVEWQREDGETVYVNMTWNPPVLTQKIVADQGQRVNNLELDETGRVLTMQTTVSSPRLPADVEYRLVYERTP